MYYQARNHYGHLGLDSAEDLWGPLWTMHLGVIHLSRGRELPRCKEPACQCRRRKRREFEPHPWVRKIPWRRAFQPTPVFLPGRIPWTEEPGGLQSMGSQSQTRLKQLSMHVSMHQGERAEVFIHLLHQLSVEDCFLQVGPELPVFTALQWPEEASRQRTAGVVA